MEHKLKSETSPFELDVYNHNEYTQIRVQSSEFEKTVGEEIYYVDIKPEELRQFIECLELLEKQRRLQIM